MAGTAEAGPRSDLRLPLKATAPEHPSATARDGAAAEPAASGRWRGAPGAVVPALLVALGPSLLGLLADNDAGGMLSYFVTGAHRGLEWTLPVLVLLQGPTLLVLSVALRVSRATGLPYSKVLLRAVGRPLTVLEAVALYGLNGLVLVTEFVGMSLALGLAGVPRVLGLGAALALVVTLTGAGRYPRIERVLLLTAVASVAFVPALLLLRPAPGALAAALAAPGGPPWFFLLALAGNAVPPWVIYWEQNAAWAGPARTARQRAWDLTAGAVAMTGLAAAALLLGALTPGRLPASVSPLAWLLRHGGRVPGVLFAVGIFEAGLLAACTVSLSSLWTLREAVGAGARDPGEAPQRGAWRLLHLVTLGAAAGAALLPGVASGYLAVWAQAVGAAWMPVSLVLLGVVARDRRIMGRDALAPWMQALLGATAAAFAALACVGLPGAVGR